MFCVEIHFILSIWIKRKFLRKYLFVTLVEPKCISFDKEWNYPKEENYYNISYLPKTKITCQRLSDFSEFCWLCPLNLGKYVGMSDASTKKSSIMKLFFYILQLEWVFIVFCVSVEVCGRVVWMNFIFRGQCNYNKSYSWFGIKFFHSIASFIFFKIRTISFDKQNRFMTQPMW